MSPSVLFALDVTQITGVTEPSGRERGGGASLERNGLLYCAVCGFVSLHEDVWWSGAKAPWLLVEVNDQLRYLPGKDIGWESGWAPETNWVQLWRGSPWALNNHRQSLSIHVADRAIPTLFIMTYCKLYSYRCRVRALIPDRGKRVFCTTKCLAGL